MQKATDDVRTAVERTRVQLPSGIDPPTVQRIDVDNAPILTYAVSAHNMSGTELSWFIDKTVTRALQGQKGVAQVLRIGGADRESTRSEEHTSELQSLMRNSYAVLCLKKKNNNK